MTNKSLLDKSLFAAAFVGIVVLINVLAVERLFARRSDEGRAVHPLRRLARRRAQPRGPADHQGLLLDDLPPPYSTNARYVKDLLEEYYSASDGDLSYEFLDPVAEETEEDKEKRKETKRDIFGRQMRQETDVERELRSVGVQPVEVRVNEGDNLEVKRVYMGISLRYGDQREVIPVVTDTRSLEYDLTTLIRKITRTEVPKIGIITGREGLDLRQDLSKVMGLLGQQYEPMPIDLATNADDPRRRLGDHRHRTEGALRSARGGGDRRASWHREDRQHFCSTRSEWTCRQRNTRNSTTVSTTCWRRTA